MVFKLGRSEFLLGDLLTELKKGSLDGKGVVEAPASKINFAVVQFLAKRGMIKSYSFNLEHSHISLKLPYYGAGYSHFRNVKLLTSPSKRVYFSSEQIFKRFLLKGSNFVVVSTSFGLMFAEEAHGLGIGGQPLFSF